MTHGAHAARIPALDGLRGFAILLVIVSHYLGQHWRSATVGWTGVSLFFVLSGFLITGILLDTKGRPHYFRNFFVRRTLRIFPLYYLVLILAFVAAPLFPALDTPAYREVAARQAWFWTYTSNLYLTFHAQVGQDPFSGDWLQLLHLWSLAIEEQFYVVWPLLVLLLSRRALMALCIGAFASAWLLRLYFADAAYNVEPYFFTLCRVDDLAAGAFVAAAVRAPGGLEKARACAPWLMILAMWVLLGIGLQEGDYFQLAANVQRFAYSAFGTLYAALLVFAIAAPTRSHFRGALENPVLRSFGKYSYAIYIFHWGLSELLFARIAPLDSFARGLGSQDRALLARLAIVISVSWGIGWLSWHGYEKHFLALKDRFATRSR